MYLLPSSDTTIAEYPNNHIETLMQKKTYHLWEFHDNQWAQGRWEAMENLLAKDRYPPKIQIQVRQNTKGSADPRDSPMQTERIRNFSFAGGGEGWP